MLPRDQAALVGVVAHVALAACATGATTPAITMPKRAVVESEAETGAVFRAVRAKKTELLGYFIFMIFLGS